MRFGSARAELRTWLRPILKAKDARGLRVLDLQPHLARTGSVRAFALLRHDALKAELAGMREDRGAVALEAWPMPAPVPPQPY